jgi:hypothetical protein
MGLKNKVKQKLAQEVAIIKVEKAKKEKEAPRAVAIAALALMLSATDTVNARG